MMQMTRRKLLKSASTLGLLGIMPKVAEAYTFSGGRGEPRCSVNLNFITSCKDYTYLNFVKSCTNPGATVDSGAIPFAACVDDKGFLIATPTNSGNISNSWIPAGFPGYWVITWTGDVNITVLTIHGTGVPSSCTDYEPAELFKNLTSSSFTLQGGEVGVETRVTFKLDPSVDRISFQTKTPFSSLVLCMGDPNGVDRSPNIPGTEEWLLSQGETFRPDFLEKLKRLNPKSVRLMQRQNVEGSHDSLFWVQNKKDSLCYGSGRWDRRLWSGDATAPDQPSLNNYQVSPPPNYPGGFPTTKTDGAMLQLRFTTAGAAGVGVTLNPGGSWGDVPVAASGQPNTQLDGTYIDAANMVVTLTYHALFDKWIFSKNWAAGGLGSAEPIEVQVELCNKIGVNYWYNVPCYYTDESIAQTIAYIAQNLNPGLKLIVEWYNEVWNGLYPGTQYCNAAAQLPPLNLSSTDFDSYFGYKMTQLFHPTTGPVVPTWTQYRKRDELICMMGTWVSNNNTSTGWRWAGTKWPSPPPIGQRPIDYCDGACIAIYSYGAQMPWAGTGGTTGYTAHAGSVRQDLWDAADDFASGNAERMKRALEFASNDALAGSYSGMTASWTVQAFNSVLSGWNDKCETYGVTPDNGKALWCYEGGYSGTEPTEAQCITMGVDPSYSEKVKNLNIAYRNSDLCKNNVLALLNQFVSFPNLRFPSYYCFCQTSDDPVASPFSMFPDNITRRPYKSYDAVAAFNSGIR